MLDKGDPTYRDARNIVMMGNCVELVVFRLACCERLKLSAYEQG
jgi:hypothetical protein